MNNNAMALLMPDNETLVQMQPVYRCGFGAPLLARWGNATDGCPQRFPNVTSIFGGVSVCLSASLPACASEFSDPCAPQMARTERMVGLG